MSKYTLSRTMLFPSLKVTKEDFFADLGKEFDPDEAPLVESKKKIGFLVHKTEEKKSSPVHLYHVESIHSGDTTSYKVQVFEFIKEIVEVEHVVDNIGRQ